MAGMLKEETRSQHLQTNSHSYGQRNGLNQRMFYVRMAKGQI